MRIIRIILFLLVLCSQVRAQELEAKVNVNHQKINQSSTAVFDDLQQQLTEFINTRQWTNMQFRKNERIRCTFNIIVNKYNESDNSFECTLSVQSVRPVYNSAYTTTAFSIQDPSFNFRFQQYDKLEFRPDIIDNELTALIAYYSYLIIGIDNDTMSPLGGTDALTVAQSIVNNAQSFPSKGWKAFDDSKNRYAIINDMLDSGMEPFRRMQYKYYREGLDIMAENADRGRAAITEAIGLLQKSHENKSLSSLPQVFTDIKADELVNIYKGKGTTAEKEKIVEILSNINASKNSSWRQMK
nr:DUF4835 family protein [uncultured Alloprevotella sp.]